MSSQDPQHKLIRGIGCKIALFLTVTQIDTFKDLDTSATGQTAPLPPISRPHIAATLLVKAHPRYGVSFPIATATQGRDRLYKFQYGPQ